MKTKDHLKLTRIALSLVNLKFPKEFVEGLEKGVMEPDIVKDLKIVRGKKYPISHHDPPKEIVEYYYNLALFYFKRGNLYLAGKALGRAIHYMQDSSISKYRFFLIFPYNAHHEIEEEINRAIETINIDLNIKEIKDKSNDPKEIVKISLLKTIGVLLSFNRDISEENNYKKIKDEIDSDYLFKIIAAGLITIILLIFLIPLSFFSLLYLFKLVLDYKSKIDYLDAKFGKKRPEIYGYTTAL